MEAAKQSLLPSYLTQYEPGQTQLDKNQEQFIIIKKKNWEVRIAKINDKDDVKEGLTNIKLLQYQMSANQNITLKELNLNVAINNNQIQAVFAADQKIEDIQKLIAQDDMKKYLKSIENRENDKSITSPTTTTKKEIQTLLDITNAEQILDTASKLRKSEKAEYDKLTIEQNKITLIQENQKIIFELEDGKRKKTLIPNNGPAGTKIDYNIHKDDILHELDKRLKEQKKTKKSEEIEPEEPEEPKPKEKTDKHIFQNIEKSKWERDKYHKTINNLEWKDTQEFMRKLLKYLLLKDKNTWTYRKDILGEDTSIEVNGYTIEIKNGAISIKIWDRIFQIVESEAKNKWFNIKHNSLAENWIITVNWITLEQDNWTPYEPKSQVDGKMMLQLLCAIVGCEEKQEPPKPEPEEPEIDNEDIKRESTITTIWKLSKDEATKVAEQEYQDIYNELRKTRKETKEWNSNFKNAKRLTRFSFNAKRIRQWLNKAKFIRNRVTELMQADANTNDLFVEKGVAAADFHEIQNKYKINTTTDETTFNNPEINDTISKYINGKLNKNEFKAEINRLIDLFKNSNDPAHAKISKYFNDIEIRSSHKKNSWVSIAATNILEKTELLKAEGELAEDIVNLYEEDLDFEEFKTQANLLATWYINNYQKIPEIKALLEETAEDPEAQEQLMLKIRQKSFIFKKKLERGKIQIDLTLLWSENDSLTKAYNVDENKLQNGLLEKRAHRVKNAHPARRRTARIWLAAAYGIGSITTMGLANTAIAGTAVWVRKRRDYADQYKNMQERMAQDYDATAERIQEQETIANDDGNNYNKIQKHMAKRQITLYKETMQENFKFTEDIINELSKALLDKNTDNLLAIVTDAMARLRMAQKDDWAKNTRIAWINFLRSRKEENAGQEYTQLHKLIDFALSSLDMDGTDIYTSNEYQTIEAQLQQEATKALNLYKKRKRNLGLKYGITAGALHGAFSAAVQFDILGYIWEKTWTTSILWSRDPTGRFGSLKENIKTQVITWYTKPTVIKTPRTYGFDNQIDADMHRIYGANYANIKSSLDQLQNSWLKYNWTEHDMLALKHQLAKSFKEWIVFKPVDASWQMEIVKLATDSGNLISNLNHGYVMNNGAFQKTLQARYGNISPDYHSFLKDQTQLTKVMKWIIDGSVDPMTLPEHQRRIAAEAFHQFFHDPKDITQLYFDKTPGSTITIPGEPIRGEHIEKRVRKSMRDRVGFPTFWQTVMRRGKKDTWANEINTPGAPKIPTTQPLPGTITGPGGRTIITDKPKFYETPTITIDKPKAKPGYTIWISTRGQEVPNDRENIKENFPHKFKEKTSKEIATIIIDNNLPLANDITDYDKITKALEHWNKRLAKELLELEINQSRENNNRYLKESKLIEKSLDAVKNAFEKLWLPKRELSFLPKKEQIHIVPELEFWGTLNYVKKGLLGVRKTMSWEIIVNCSAMWDRKNNPKLTEANLIETIIHEIIHDMWVNNYWKIQERNKAKDGPKRWGKERYEPRRVGMLMFRREKDEHGNILLRESGRARNEALTNRATDVAIKQIYPNGAPEWIYKTYRWEEEVLKLIEKQFNITSAEMIQPLINRKATDETWNIPKWVESKGNPLRIIKEKIEWRETVDGKRIAKRPYLMDLIIWVMDFEEDTENYNYTKTKELINLITQDLTEKRQDFIITKDMQKLFRKWVLDDAWKHALEIEKQYAFIKIEWAPQAQWA